MTVQLAIMTGGNLDLNDYSQTLPHHHTHKHFMGPTLYRAIKEYGPRMGMLVAEGSTVANEYVSLITPC